MDSTYLSLVAARQINEDIEERQEFAQSLELRIAEIRPWITEAKKQQAKPPVPGNQHYVGLGDAETLVQTRDQMEKLKAQVAETISVLHRMATDDRMQQAYELMANAVAEDDEPEREKKCRAFVGAAWRASAPYTKHRERVKQAQGLKEQIAKTAASLAILLRKCAKTSVEGPDEFFSVRELLGTTDNTDPPWHKLGSWTVRRHKVLGQRCDKHVSEDGQIDGCDALTVSPAAQAGEDTRQGVLRAWEAAPPLAALLETLAKAAHDFEVGASGHIYAALASQKPNAKMEYLRALADILVSEFEFDLTIETKRAMATTANVVLDSPDVDASYDDVCKAVKLLAPKNRKKERPPRRGSP